jgi:processive 1,2-diacylglycerol beta-glucosyltransferase
VTNTRVLVVSASMGGGHDGAGRELVQRLEAQGNDAQMVDFLRAFPLRIGWIVRAGYWFELRFAPWTYEATYRLWYLLPAMCLPIVALVRFLTGRRMLRWVRDYRPDVVVSTYPLASVTLGHCRQKGRLRVPLATFVTDFAVHPLWTHPGVDVHLCVHPRSAEVAAERSGGPALAPGPLVPERFRADLPDRHQARQALGLDDGERLVLVVAGAWGIGDVSHTFDALVASGRYTPLAVCGNNVRLRTKLERRGGGHVLGWTDQMPLLMAASDALIQNAGGLTCMEALAAGLPVVSFLPIAGHGRDNAEQMQEAGVAAYATDAEELATALDRATSVAGRGMVTAGQAMFAGDAADEVVALAGAEPERVPGAVAGASRAERPAFRRLTTAVASLAAAYTAFTVGVGTATAHGIGVAHAPRNVDAVYLAVRLGPRSVGDPTVAAALARTGTTAIVPGRLAREDPAEVNRLRIAGVEVANGGWGHRDRLHWGRARSDLVKASHAIRDASGVHCREFVPQRRIDGFDLASARLVHQRVVVPTKVLAPGEMPAKVRSGQVYVIDARDATPAAILQEIDQLQRMASAGELDIAPLAQLK